MTAEYHQDFRELCRKIGWRCTSQRLAVYDLLCGNKTHPDVDTVWRAVRHALPAITRESTYRILNEFADKGLISRLDHIESARYDSRTLPHGHFICEHCGAISDFELAAGESFPQVKVPGRVHHLEFRAVGLCASCADADGAVSGGEKTPPSARASLKRSGAK